MHSQTLSIIDASHNESHLDPLSNYEVRVWVRVRVHVRVLSGHEVLVHSQGSLK